MSPDLKALQDQVAVLTGMVTTLQAQVAALQSSLNALAPLLAKTDAIRQRQEDAMFNLLLIERATRKSDA